MNDQTAAQAEKGLCAPAPFLSPKLINRLRLALTLATIAVLAWYLHNRPASDWIRSGFRWEWFACGAFALPALVALRAHKWRILLRGAAPDITLMQSLRSYLGAMALGLVTPARVGEFSRGLYLPHASVQGWRAAGLVLIDNWIDFLAVLAWAVLGLWHAYGVKGACLGILALLVFAPITWWLRLAGKAASRLPAAKGLRSSAGDALAAGGHVSDRDWAEAMFVGLAAYGLEWAQAAALLAFLSPEVPDLARVAGLMALISLANSFQVTLAGLGVRESVAMVLLAGVGVGPEAAVLAAFLQTALNLFVPAVAGLAVKPVALEGGGVRRPDAS